MQALEDINVVSLSQIYNGPYCALLLSYLGADVIKVEPPGGENIRSRDEEGDTPEVLMLNSTKESITLNLKDSRGKELLKELVCDADILVENYGSGVMDRLELGYDKLSEINPKLIYGHGSGYGETGPYTDYPAMDLTVQAMGGVMDVTGFPDTPPVKTGIQVADFTGGIHLLAGILSALYQREQTGKGQFVEVGMMDAVYPMMMSPMASYYRSPNVPSRTGNRHSGLARSPYNVYETSDGYIAIICVNERHWNRLTEAMDQPSLKNNSKFDTMKNRTEHIDEVDAVIEEWTKERERDLVTDILLEAGVPCGPVKTRDEVLFDPHLEERGMVNEIDHPRYGKIRVPGLPINLDDSEMTEITPAPAVGESNHKVYRSLGLSDEEIQELENGDVI